MTQPTILVVEDNPTTRKMLRLALQSESYAVLEAGDARTALELTARTPPALILQDLILPDLDGLELVRRLRACPGCGDVPILALSGFLTKLEEARTAGSGFTGFLVKPIEPDRLIEIIQSYLPARHPRHAASGGGRRVLVADDDPVQLKLLGLHLAHAGFAVVTAPDGAQALRLAREAPPDLIVSDVLMPVLDGFELCLAVRRDPGLQQVPVVLLSFQYLQPEDQELARRVGANRLLARSLDPEELYQALDEALEAGAPAGAVQPVERLKGEHALRVIRQLERQVGLNAGLSQRCALQAAELSLLCGVADALARNVDIDDALRDVLGSCLDAAGISRGALYLTGRDGALTLHHAIGYRAAERAEVAGFFGHAAVLEQALAGELALPVPSAAVGEAEAGELLARARVTSLLIVPLVSSGRRLGALFVGSQKTDMTGADQIAFVRALGSQIGQTVALTMAFARLGQSEQRYRALWENANDGFAVRTEDGTIVEVNRAMARLLGCPADQLVGHHLLEFAAPGERDHVVAGFEPRAADGRVRTGDLRLRARDGREVVVDFSSALVDTGDGRLILAVARDMTERRAAEDALRASEARFRSLVESMSDVVFTLDAEQRLTGVFGRRRLAREGVPLGEDLGRTARDVVGAERAAVHEAANARALAGESVIYDWAYDGSRGPRQYQSSLSPIRDAAGRVTGIVGVSRDVTEEKRLQAQLMMSDRMVSVGMLAAGVAHEINNPLAAVMANLDLVNQEVGAWRQGGGPGGGLDATLDELRDAREGAERVRLIVRDLKVFSHTDEDRRGPVDVARVLESCIRMAWNEIRHRARLTTAFGPVPPVEGTESRLGQVFLNLLVNAAQAIPEGQAQANEITVRTGLDEAGRVLVVIADTGGGMAPEILARLFTPFFTTKPAGVGTGLGLSICHRIVTAIGGTITVESQVGKGTEFRVRLPRAAAAAPPGAGAGAAAPGRAVRRGRVLIIDDEAAVCRAVRRSLEAEHDVVTLTRAAEALALIAAGDRFDVIFCDLMMPEMTGMDLHAELRRVAPDQADDMVFLTGGAFTPRARDFLDVTPNLRIEKPFETPNLRAVVNARVR